MSKKFLGFIGAVGGIILSLSSVNGCPQWECQLDINDYSCGGVHNGCTSAYSDSCTPVYDETTTYNQYIYCPYCGHEMWDCVCNQANYCESYSEYDNCYSNGVNEAFDGSYDYSCEFNETSETSMNHWANVRDCNGNIVAQVGAGSSVEVLGVDSSNPDRVLIYDPCTGTYGSVLSECVYGNYQWDGSGDNGVYNTYNGSSCTNSNSSYECDNYNESYNEIESSTTSCDQANYSSCSSYNENYAGTYEEDTNGWDAIYDCDSSCNYAYPCSSNYVRYVEVISVIREFEASTGCCDTWSHCFR